MTDTVKTQLSSKDWQSRLTRFVGIILTQIVVFQHLPGWDGEAQAWMPMAEVAFEWIKVASPAVVGLYTAAPKK